MYIYCSFRGSEDTQINIGTQLRVGVEILLLKRVECGPGRQYQVLDTWALSSRGGDSYLFTGGESKSVNFSLFPYPKEIKQSENCIVLYFTHWKISLWTLCVSCFHLNICSLLHPCNFPQCSEVQWQHEGIYYKWASVKMTLKFHFLWSTLFWLEESASAV